MRSEIAVVGSGYWGKNLVRNFAELGALHTICDTDPKILKSFASLYPNVNAETDYHRVLANQEVRGVVIAAPAVSHYLIAKEALSLEKDVLVEKPLALEVGQGEELVELAERNNRVLLVGHLLEYHPAVVKLKELIDNGELGKINYIYSNRLNLGKFRTEENILWSFAPHDISIILLLIGEMPLEVSAHGGYYLHQDIADVTLTTLGFRNGIKAHIFVSWLHPYKEQKLIVVGDKKMALFDDTNPKEKLFLYSHEIDWIDRRPVPRQKNPESIDVPLAEPLKLECQDFLDCIQSRRKPKVDGHKGLQVLRILSSCQQSLEDRGKVIYLNKDTNSVFIHETSIVENGCSIGDGTKIWHFSHIMPDVRIGKNCVIGQNVFVGRVVKIGDNVKIENNVSVFEGVTLEDGVFCGPSCVFTNVINPRSQISRKHELKPTLVKKGATIGANATIICGNAIGSHAFVGAGAVVSKDVPDHALVYGNPAKVQGWACECGVKLDFGTNGVAKCSGCGKKYKKQENKKGTTIKDL
ncbi:MAG: oxidoreductase [Chloroflexi bacterium]|nr:oxidoreductase [Chloroflexota bacterium]